MNDNNTSIALSKYNPLNRILFFDNFDDGLHGWTELIGNYEGSLDNVLSPYRDHRPPQLSTLSMWDTGSAGSMDGMYALKIATRAKKGHQAVSIKRITYRELGKIRMEAYFCFKPEAVNLCLGDNTPRSFGFLFDMQNGQERIMPHVRYLNALDGKPVNCWQTKRKPAQMHSVGKNHTVSHYHLSPDGWENIPDGHQLLCYNEIETKHNWHYLRFDFDLKSMCFLALQCNDRIFDTTGLDSIRYPAMPNLWCMLNLAFFVETDTDQRTFGYLDSVVLSQED